MVAGRVMALTVLLGKEGVLVSGSFLFAGPAA